MIYNYLVMFKLTVVLMEKKNVEKVNSVMPKIR